MKFSCCVWALSGPELATLNHLATLGFNWIDLQPFTFTDPAAKACLTELNLQISCVGASFGLPEGTSLDAPDTQVREQAVTAVKNALQYTADLGATVAYVIPGLDDSPAGLARYGASLIAIADTAATLGLKVGIEHFPGRALPTAAGTLAFLDSLNHPNLYLLFDLGHIQLSKEDPAAVIKAAGERLCYVHLDDNDGKGDLHWSLLDGVMTQESLQQTFAALDEIGYKGAISLELSPQLPNPYESLQKSRQIVLDVLSNN